MTILGRNKFRTAILGGCLVALGACAGLELDNAQRVTPVGSEFNRGLFAGYVDLSEAEFAEYDYRDSDGFAVKAISAAGGNFVGPADLADWNISDSATGELGSARSRLVSALDGSGRTKAPGTAARAQVMFDCWVQEQEENIQPEDIAACRSGFYNAIVALEVAMRPEPVVAEVTPEPEPEPMMEPEPAYATYYVVFFDFNDTALSADARQTIRDAAEAAIATRPFKILVYGHTDRSGSIAYNRKLAEKRATAVAQYLIDQGAGRFVIDVEAFGEDQPVIQTSDNVQDGRNRRVEITLSDQ